MTVARSPLADNTWVKASVPESVLTFGPERSASLARLSQLADASHRRRVERTPEGWTFWLSPQLAGVVQGVVAHLSASGVDLVLDLVEVELLSGTPVFDVLHALVDDARPAGDAVLTAAQEAELARGGSLVRAMPPMAQRASVRTKLEKSRMLADALSVREVAELLGVSDSRIRQRAVGRSLLVIRATEGLRFPRFQFPDNAELPGWDQVAPHFPAEAHPVGVARFMQTPVVDLEIEGQPVTPIQWLAEGGSPRVVADLVDGAYLIA